MGTFQFGDGTVAMLKILLAQSKDGQRVNSVFGEGVNPRLRKIRDGLNELGQPADEPLNHGTPRLVYGLPLIRNLREYLLGIDARPRFIVDRRRVTEEIIEWWRGRWVARVSRVQRREAETQCWSGLRGIGCPRELIFGRCCRPLSRPGTVFPH
jgi:hypothetical protein